MSYQNMAPDKLRALIERRLVDASKKNYFHEHHPEWFVEFHSRADRLTNPKNYDVVVMAPCPFEQDSHMMQYSFGIDMGDAAAMTGHDLSQTLWSHVQHITNAFHHHLVPY